MPFLVAKATAADIPAITNIFLMNDEGPSSLMQLCLGTVDRKAINMRQASRISEGLKDPLVKWLIARDQDTKRTASFAQWQLPFDDENDEEPNEDEVESERNTYRNALTPGLNVELCVRFKDEIESLRARTIKGRRHYLLMNLGTSAAWQRKGAASTLVQWAFSEADKTNTIVYLDTASDGPGRSMYERLGFKKVGECSMDLAEYGGEGVHTHIAMIRYPVVRRESGVVLVGM